MSWFGGKCYSESTEVELKMLAVFWRAGWSSRTISLLSHIAKFSTFAELTMLVLFCLDAKPPKF